MKLLVISKELKRPIRLRLPNSLLKSRWLWKTIRKNNKDNDFDFILMEKIIRDGYKELKKFIKTNGHFTLVEVIDGDGEIVRIII